MRAHSVGLSGADGVDLLSILFLSVSTGAQPRVLQVRKFRREKLSHCERHEQRGAQARPALGGLSLSGEEGQKSSFSENDMHRHGDQQVLGAYR